MRKAIGMFIVLSIIIGCSTTMSKHRKYIRDGMLISGLSQFAFAEEWGKPDKQGTWVEEGGHYRLMVGIRGAEVGGRRRAFNDVWIYEKHNRILFFSNHQLVAHFDWDEYQKIERERKELPAIMK